MSFYYLLDAQAKNGILILRLYDDETDEIVEIEEAGYKPYFYLPYPLTETDEANTKSLHGKVKIVKKCELFTGKIVEVARVAVHLPDTVRRARKTFEKIWEAEIEFAHSYVYDHDLVFGAPLRKTGSRFLVETDIPKELIDRFESAFAEIRDISPVKYSQIRRWFGLLTQPVPEIGPESLDVKEVDPEHLRRAFMLARLANIPVKEAYQSRRVSDWLRSIIHTYLRKNNILIPTSRELRRGQETHRVPGALTLEPKVGVYFNTVVCDFESLYPSCIDSYNLSYETVDCLHEECRGNSVIECEGHWICTRRRGFYSILVGALKDLRVGWYKPLSKDTTIGEDERGNAEVLTKLLKLISVSSYGVTVRIHGLACPPLAECITSCGRWALQTTWNMAKIEGLSPTYGDTDSIFLDNPQLKQVEWLVETVKEKLKLDLAVEKQYSLCVLPTAKKAYFGILRSGEPDIKGLTAIKSNSPNFIRRVFKKCVRELSDVKNLEEYELAKKRIVDVVKQAVRELREGRVQLEDLVYSVKLYTDPKERLETGAKVTPQPYQCAIQLMDMGKEIGRGETVRFIKVKPFNYKGKTFTVKPARNFMSKREINVEDYIRNMATALNQTFAPMGIDLEPSMNTKLSDWFK